MANTATGTSRANRLAGFAYLILAAVAAMPFISGYLSATPLNLLNVISLAALAVSMLAGWRNLLPAAGFGVQTWLATRRIWNFGQMGLYSMNLSGIYAFLGFLPDLLRLLSFLIATVMTFRRVRTVPSPVRSWGWPAALYAISWALGLGLSTVFRRLLGIEWYFQYQYTTPQNFLTFLLGFLGLYGSMRWLALGQKVKKTTSPSPASSTTSRTASTTTRTASTATRTATSTTRTAASTTRATSAPAHTSSAPAGEVEYKLNEDGSFTVVPKGSASKAARSTSSATTRSTPSATTRSTPSAATRSTPSAATRSTPSAAARPASPAARGSDNWTRSDSDRYKDGTASKRWK